MNKVVRIVGFIALWVVIATTTILLTVGGRSRRANMAIERIEVNLVDSTEEGNLITRDMVLGMLRSRKISPVGMPIDKVPLTFIERVVGENGFVEGVRCYANYRGVLYIDVEQRGALARVLLDGYNCYITEDGHIFDAPRSTALNTSVVTGDYRPIFEPGFVGSIDSKLAEKLEKLDRDIERVEREKYPILQREIDNNEDKREVRRRYINKRFMESQDDFDKRVVKVREENRLQRVKLAYREKVINKELGVLSAKQERYRDEQKKMVKKCDDLHNLITFVDMVESDPFWRSEIVQIIADSDKYGNMRVSFAVRSGGFLVTLGELSPRSYLSREHFDKRLDEARDEIAGRATRSDDEVRDEIETKLDRLLEFYDEALPRVGWERYKQINVEFSNQVVCKR